MSEKTKTSLLPHFVIGTAILAVILAVFFWPSEQPQEVETVVIPPPVEQPAILPEPVIEAPIVPPLPPEPITPEPEISPPVVVQAPEPEPLDLSDGAVKTKLISLSDYDAFARLLIDDSVLQRFVVTTTSLADETISPSHRVLNNPEKPFRTYKQADKDWIDPASYKRYTPYVDVFDSLETESLLGLYQEYKPAIEEIFAEISGPDDDFNEKLIDAIDILLDTPEVPVPVEVFTDSVMFKFADPQLEELAAPQKQLLRTGPENMRRIKAKLREVKQALQD
jgi:hypothetical protein